MANLPPRPETPSKLRDERRPVDDRDRDRRPTLPMAPSRVTRPLPERERVYVPPRRPDTYIPGGYESRREGDHRDYDNRDQDWDRYREFERERDRRAGGRDRDYDRSPRKWEAPDRDRRVYDRDRGPYKRPVSPIRRSGPGRRDSRSPPRRRGPRSRSRSPPYRSRPRSRSRSPRHSPLPSKRVRLGNHSIGGSPRSRSPRKRSRSRVRSLSPKKRPAISSVPPLDKQQALEPQMVTSTVKKEELTDTKPSVEDSKSIFEEKPIALSSSDVTHSQGLQPSNIKEENEPQIIQQSAQPEPNQSNTGISSQPNIKIVEIKSDSRGGRSPRSPAESKSIKMDTTEDADVKKMDIDSPISTPIISNISNNPTRSPSPQPSRNVNDHQRANIPTGPQRNWPNRSPPRGPRNHPRPGPNPQNQPPAYSMGRRDSRRPYPVQGQSPLTNSLTKGENEGRLPPIPKYDRTKGGVHDISALETELSRLRGLRVMHAQQDLIQVKALQRAFHELDMASIDLQAAEGRRRVADAQLDKAKTGSLGIDAPDLVDVDGTI